MEDLIGYADYVNAERKGDGDCDAKPAPVTLIAGDGLLPLLPPPINGVRGTETAKQAQEIIRAYFLRHYRESEVTYSGEIVSEARYRSGHRIREHPYAMGPNWPESFKLFR